MILLPDVRIDTLPDLTRAWLLLRGRLRFAAPLLWVLRIDRAGRPGPLLTVGGLPDGPYDVRLHDLRALVGEHTGAGFALLYGRPGPGPWHVDDRAWVRFLAPAAVWPVHLARDDVLERAGPDVSRGPGWGA